MTDINLEISTTIKFNGLIIGISDDDDLHENSDRIQQRYNKRIVHGVYLHPSLSVQVYMLIEWLN